MAAPKRTPARKAPRRAVPAAPKVAAAPPEALPANVEIARNLFNASLAPVHGWLRFMAQWRETQAELLHQMDKALGATLREAEGAADVQELFRLQGDLATHNLSRGANAAGALFRTWLETEAAMLEQAREQSVDVTRQMVQDMPAAAPAENRHRDATLIPATALLSNAQAAWTQAAQQWIESVRGATVH